ncbi:MAG: aconitate hydratase, partial [Longimicrobiales bacterium]
FRKSYADVFAGDARWQGLQVPEGDRFKWDDSSTYVRQPTFLEGMTMTPEPPADILGARVLALLGDSITTDHISPAGSIKLDGPAGRYLREHGVEAKEFNSYGSRRGNHEVMVRGTFANIRLRNQLTPEIEGGWTKHLPSGEQMTIFDASMRYQADGVPLVVVAGKEYGSGSSRDWAAKGPLLLGVRAVIVESYERIHRSNLIGMGIIPLQFLEGDSYESVGIKGTEVFDITGIDAALAADGGTRTVKVIARNPDTNTHFEFDALVRIDTPQEAQYYRHGGILQFVLRGLLKG